MRLGQRWWWWAAALAAGLWLRAVFVGVHPRFVGDTLVYGDLARNLLAGHGYGLTEDGHVRATLIRLPGYPLFLAVCFFFFGAGNFLAVVWVQVAVDLLGCWLLGRLAARLFGERVSLVCLWMAALCPFTANYAAAALTETLSIFSVVLSFWGLAKWISGGRVRWAVLVGIGMSGAALLRPDGVLLAAAVVPAMGWVAWSRTSLVGEQSFSLSDKPKSLGRERVARPWLGVFVALGFVLAFLGVWAGRNWRVFHVLQPLAPKYANDPGEPAPLGFARWYRTWGVGLGDTARVYWQYDGGELRLADLPSWAFDSAAQRAETARVYVAYNADLSSTPSTEAAFQRLAAERERAHPVRSYVGMPLARLADMWLRPRTELLPRMPLTWWRLGERPGLWRGAVLFAWGYGLLNVALLGCAGAGMRHWWRAGWGRWGAFAGAMAGFVLLRSGLLMAIDNSEPRYVLECYPVVLLLAAFGVSRWRADRCKSKQVHSEVLPRKCG